MHVHLLIGASVFANQHRMRVNQNQRYEACVGFTGYLCRKSESTVFMPYRHEPGYEARVGFTGHKPGIYAVLPRSESPRPRSESPWGVSPARDLYTYRL